MKKNRNILLTGATGVVGQHILFELLHQMEQEGSAGAIWLVVRSSAEKAGETRIRELLTHPYAPQYIRNYPLETLMNRIGVIDGDLTSPKIRKALASFTKEEEFDVIHCAASTNIGSSEKDEQEVKFANYHSTLNLLKAVAPFARKFIFISTAFSCGRQKGLISEDFLSLRNVSYRNPYERFKAECEKEVVKFCEENGILWQISRPSIVCGRLLDAPLYYTQKFDVFYGFTKFFYKLMETPFGKTSLRLMANINEAGSNVVPVDYVAKAIVAAIPRDDIKQLNIALSKAIPLKISLPRMIEINGYTNYTIVDRMPEKMNLLEAAYYAELGQISGPYINDELYNYDVTTLRTLLKHIPEPDYETNAAAVLNYAVQRKFEDFS
jgi:thioester reductase-like protein